WDTALLDMILILPSQSLRAPSEKHHSSTTADKPKYLSFGDELTIYLLTFVVPVYLFQAFRGALTEIASRTTVFYSLFVAQVVFGMTQALDMVQPIATLTFVLILELGNLLISWNLEILK
ncbi:hypothetical protein ACJX0J_010977, partial [Zea mays]